MDVADGTISMASGALFAFGRGRVLCSGRCLEWGYSPPANGEAGRGRSGRPSDYALGTVEASYRTRDGMTTIAKSAAPAQLHLSADWWQRDDSWEETWQEATGRAVGLPSSGDRSRQAPLGVLQIEPKQFERLRGSSGRLQGSVQLWQEKSIGLTEVPRFLAPELKTDGRAYRWVEAAFADGQAWCAVEIFQIDGLPWENQVRYSGSQGGRLAGCLVNDAHNEVALQEWAWRGANPVELGHSLGSWFWYDYPLTLVFSDRRSRSTGQINGKIDAEWLRQSRLVLVHLTSSDSAGALHFDDPNFQLPKIGGSL